MTTQTYSKELDADTAAALEAEHVIKAVAYYHDHTQYVDAQGREYTCNNTPLDDLFEKIFITGELEGER